MSESVTRLRVRMLRVLLASKAGLVAGLIAVLVVSGLTVHGIVSVSDDALPAFDPAGDAVDVPLDGTDPMERPKPSKGVKLGKPDSAPGREVKTQLPLKATQECGQASEVDAVLGIAKGSKVCAPSAVRQSPVALKGEPLQTAPGFTATELPQPQTGPTTDPTTEASGSATPGPAASDDAADGGEPEDPAADPSAEPSAEPSAVSSGSPSTDPTPAQAGRAVAKPAAFEPGSARVVNAGMVATVQENAPGTYLSPNWTKLAPVSSPASYMYGNLVYDDVRDQFTYFGGTADGVTYSNETWVWTHSGWVKQNPVTKPVARVRASAAWDPVQGKIILFGGQSNATTPLNDVWAWDGTNWTQQTPAGGPLVARTGAAMAFDVNRGGLIVFGGLSTSGTRNDTWQLKNNTWTPIQANGVAGAPAPRNDPSLAYSLKTSQLVLFGGRTGNCPSCTLYDDTWVLGPTASSWTEQTPAHTPPMRGNAGLTYDADMEALILFGGITSDGSTTSFLADTWAWTGTDWLKANGIAAPSGRAGMAMASDSQGRTLMFGGTGSADGPAGPETWTYDPNLPLIDVVVGPAEQGVVAPAYYMVGDAIRVTITVVNAGISDIVGGDNVSVVSALDDTVFAAGSEILWGDGTQPPSLLSYCTNDNSLCGGISDLTTTISNIGIPVGATRVGDFVATLVGTQRGCELVDIPAAAASLLGGANETFKQVTVCGGGLGLEKWWTYDTTDLGNGGTASVNSANGNLVVTHQDTPPVQTAGHLQLGLSRVYNSQGTLGTDGALGGGWQFDLGGTGETSGGYGLSGLNLPNVQNLTQPLSIPYVDRDGTRHIFKLRSVGATLGNLSLPVDLTHGVNGILGSLLGTLDSLKLTDLLTGDRTDVCIDEAYTGPKGSNMFLFRYIGVNQNGCSNPNNNAIPIGWSLVRPDRLRYDFNEVGDLRTVTDQTGQQILFDGNGDGYDPRGPEVIHPASCKTGAACPTMTVDYDVTPLQGPTRRVEVKDSAGRVTTYVVTRDPLPRLVQVWEPGNPWVDRPVRVDVNQSIPGPRPSWEYIYATGNSNTGPLRCPGNPTDAVTAGQLCTAIDASGHATTFSYGKAPLGPDRILKVTDRSGNAADGATKGLATRYTWHDKPDGAPDYVTADMAAAGAVDSCGTTCQRIRYSKIDAYGRVGEIAEGTSDNVFTRQAAYFWDGGEIGTCAQPSGAVNHNLCQTIRKAVPVTTAIVPGDAGAGTSEINGVTVHDEAIAYQYSDLGQVLSKNVMIDGSAAWTGTGTANSAITTYGTVDQYFDASGARRVYNNHVTGDGKVKSTGVGEDYAAVVKDDDPVAYWRLDEAPGATTMQPEVDPSPTNAYRLFSVASQGEPGPIEGHVSYREPSGNFGALFTGLSGFAHGTTPADSDFTVETWQKTSSAATEAAILWGLDSNTFGLLGRSAGGFPAIVLAAGSAANEAVVTSDVAVNDGQWHHVVYTYNGNGHTSGMSIWVDGVKQPVSTQIDNLGTAEYAPATAYTQLFKGTDSSIDEVALYPSVLPEDRIKRHHAAATGGDRVKPATLYAVTDQVQALSARGNTPGAAWGEFLTTTHRDIPQPGDSAGSINKADGPICVPGDPTPGNSGLACETDTPASDGVAGGDCHDFNYHPLAGAPTAATNAGYASTCTTYEYNQLGQRTKMQTPKSHATGGGSYEYKYYDTVTTCAAENRPNCDLSGTVSAGGWLKAVVDPAGEKTIFAYDNAGNIARTWERNATHGKPLTAAWSDPSANPSSEYTEQVNATPVTSDSLSVSASALITIAPNGTAFGAGTNGQGELGDGTTTIHSAPVTAKGVNNLVAVAQTATGSVAGCASTLFLTGDGEVYQAGGGNSTPTKSPLSDTISIAAGGCHFLALDAQGRLFTWGEGGRGQLGTGSTGDLGAPDPQSPVLTGVSTVAAGATHSLAVKTDGTVWSWGGNTNGELGLGDTSDRSTPTKITTLPDARSLAAGVGSSFAIGRDGKVWAWGTGADGALGLGNTTQQTTPTASTLLGAATTAGAVRQIVAGDRTGAALMADGTVRAWGLNSSGQLGAGTATSTSPVAVPGVTSQVAIAGGAATYATANAAGKVTVWGATGGRQLADGTVSAPPPTSTPTTAGLNISPYRQPGWQLLGRRDATGNLTTQTTDRLGQVRRVRSGRGHEVYTSAFDRTIGYDAAGRPTWSSGAQHRAVGTTTSVTYDPFGNPVKTVDARGQAARATFDAVNRQLTSQVARGTSAEAPATCTAVATGADWTSAQDGMKVCTTSRTYDGLDRPVTATDANLQVTRFWADAMGRETRRDIPRGDGTYDWVTTRRAYNKDSQLIRECSPRQDAPTAQEPLATPGSCDANGRYSTDFEVNRAGLTSKATRYRNTVPLETSFTFDADGNTGQVADPNHHSTTQTFDLQGRLLTRVVPRSATKSFTTSWNYDYSGNVTSTVSPGSMNTGTGVAGDLVVDGTTAAASTDGAVHGAANPFKVPDGAQYRNVTLQNGAYLTANAANGLLFKATGTLTVCATCVITMTGKGYAGGAKAANAANPNPGNGGLKGGGTFTVPGAGGGGGGHQNAGATGVTRNASVPGAGGLASGNASFSGVGATYLNGSGGGGGGGGTGALGAGGAGGAGGGYIRITAGTIIVNGVVTAAGNNGANGTTNSGGGGGGAGGGIWLTAEDIQLANAGVLVVTGGAGGTGAGDANGGAGSVGRIRVDADTVTNSPVQNSGSNSTTVTATSYDAANRPVDTIEGAQTLEADPAKDNSSFAAPDTDGLANTRTRAVYNADGMVAAILPPTAFSNAASLTAPNLDVARRVDYDLDGQAVRAYSPRYSASVTSVTSGGDGGTSGLDQQAAQCTTGRPVDRVAGIGTYGSTVGVCLTRAEYDAAGNLARQWLPTSNGSDKRYLDYEYTPDGLTRTVSGPDPNDDNATIVVSSTRYDGVGRPTRVADALGNASLTSYTGDGLVKQTSSQAYTLTTGAVTGAPAPDDSPDPTLVTEITKFGYDANGNQITSTNPKNDNTTQTWTTDGLVASIKAPGDGTGFQTTEYTYDNVGNPIQVLDPEGQKRYANSGTRKPVVNQFTDDNLLSYSHTPIHDTAYRSVKYTYSPAGVKTATETARCATGTVTDCTPSNGAWNSAGVMRLTYGANGRVADQGGRDKSSISTTYTQDGLPKTIVDPTSAVTITAGYYLDGLLRTADNGSNANTYAYDASGQATVRTDQTPSGGVTAGAKVTTSYAYGAAGLPSKMNSQVLDAVSTYAFDDAGRLDTVTTGTHVSDYSWHPNNSLAGVRNSSGATTISEFVYRYDRNRNITEQKVTGSAAAYTNTFDYWPGQQVKSFGHDGAADDFTTSYVYDRNSNRKSATTTPTGGGSASTSTWTYRLDNSIEQFTRTAPNPADPDLVQAFHYNNAGLQDSDGCATTSYDDFDRIATVILTQADAGKPECDDEYRTTTYSYDGLDRQHTIAVTGAKTANQNDTTKSVYDGLSATVVGQKDAAAGDGTAPDLLYQMDPMGQAFAYDQKGGLTAHKAYLDTDGHGNVTNLVTPAGANACAVAYDPWGGAIDTFTTANSNGMCKNEGNPSQEQATGNAVWYRGTVRDGSTGSYQFGTRSYNPSTGAFTTPDSYRVASPSTDLSVGTDPLTANTYTYVNGNPLNAWDPDGHRPECIEFGTCAAANHQLGVWSGGLKPTPTGGWVKAADTLPDYVPNQNSIVNKVVEFVKDNPAEAAGYLPFVGDAVDLLSAVYYGVNGDWAQAGMSSLAIIPFVGSPLKTALRHGDEVVHAIDSGLKHSDDLADVASDASKTLDPPTYTRTRARHNEAPKARPQAAKPGTAIEKARSKEVETWYPANDGFLGKPNDIYLQPGQLIDRYGGSERSRFFSPQGVPDEMRSLPPGVGSEPLRTFEVVKPFPVQAGTVAPAFQQLGLGTQYRSPVQLGVLVRRGILREVGR